MFDTTNIRARRVYVILYFFIYSYTLYCIKCVCVCVCVVGVPRRGRSADPAAVLPRGHWRALLQADRQGRGDGLPRAHQLQPQVAGTATHLDTREQVLSRASTAAYKSEACL